MTVNTYFMLIGENGECLSDLSKDRVRMDYKTQHIHRVKSKLGNLQGHNNVYNS